MPLVFISYVHNDEKIARQIADGLERQGIRTWYYSRDSLVGDYLENIVRALEDCNILVMIISPSAIQSPNQVNKEVIRAHEMDKKFRPILVDISWDELGSKHKGWRFILGSSIGITWKDENPDKIINEIAKSIPDTGGKPPQEPEIGQVWEPVPKGDRIFPNVQAVPPIVQEPVVELFAPNGALNLERFEPSLRQAIYSLPQEVQLVGHNLIGTPHIFNVLLGIPAGLTQQILTSLSIDPGQLRVAIRNTIRRADLQVSERIPPLIREAFSPNGLASLESAQKIASQEGRSEISEADILLAIVSNKESVTMKMIDQVDHLGDKILAALKPGGMQVEEGLKLADETRLILTTALNEAYTSGFNTIETPHFITAITRLPGSKIAQALQMQGQDLEVLRNAMNELMPPVGPLSQAPPALTWEVYSSRMQDVLNLADADAHTRGDGAISEINLAAGMSQAESSLTVEFLRWMGVDFDKMIEDIAAMPVGASQGQPASPQRTSQPPPASQPATGQQPAAQAPAPQASLAGDPSASARTTASLYSNQVVQVLRDAQSLAFQYGYPRVETPFLLMALCLAPDGCLGRGLQAQGYDAQIVLNALRGSMKPAGAPKSQATVEITDLHTDLLSPRIQNILKIGEEQARKQGVQMQDCHLLAGFLRSQGGQTTAFLERLRINLPALLEFALKED